MSKKIANRPNDDLFQNTSMTFGEHIEELRVCLFKALVGLFVGFLIGLYFANGVVQAIQLPLRNALMDFYVNKAKTEVNHKFGSRYEKEILSVIEEQRLIPDRVLFDPDAMMTVLQDGRLQTYQPSASTGYKITLIDIVDLPKFATRLLDDTKPAAKHLVSQLSAEGQAALKHFATPGAKDTDADRVVAEQLVAALNLLLNEPKLYDATAFQQVSLPEEAPKLQEFLAGGSGIQYQRRLNWLLIQAVAGSEVISSPHLKLAEAILWRSAEDDDRVQPQSLGVEEPFMVWIKAALLTGAVVASPWIFYQIWSFVAAGLYPHERKYIHIYLPFSIFLFLSGAALAYFFVFKYVLAFLFTFNQSLNVNPDPKIGQWLNFFLLLPVGFGISFQLPLVMLFLQRIGLFTVQAYLEKWRIAIMTIFIISALLTPADPYSLLFMAIPLTLLYFGGILICHWFPGGRAPYDADAAEAT